VGRGGIGRHGAWRLYRTAKKLFVAKRYGAVCRRRVTSGVIVGHLECSGRHRAIRISTAKTATSRKITLLDLASPFFSHGCVRWFILMGALTNAQRWRAARAPTCFSSAPHAARRMLTHYHNAALRNISTPLARRRASFPLYFSRRSAAWKLIWKRRRRRKGDLNINGIIICDKHVISISSSL
jgi:hypothetical protein